MRDHLLGYPPVLEALFGPNEWVKRVSPQRIKPEETAAGKAVMLGIDKAFTDKLGLPRSMPKDVPQADKSEVLVSTPVSSEGHWVHAGKGNPAECGWYLAQRSGALSLDGTEENWARYWDGERFSKAVPTKKGRELMQMSYPIFITVQDLARFIFFDPKTRRISPLHGFESRFVNWFNRKLTPEEKRGFLLTD